MTRLGFWNATVNSLAQYSIDNGTLFPFRVAAGPISLVQAYNLVSFKTPVLSSGSHRLFVQYGVDNPNGSTPLVLDYFIIQNHTISSTTTPIDSHVGSKFSAGALTGIIIGSMVGGALITLGLIWAIRFIKQKLVAAKSPGYEACGDGQDTN